MVHTMLVATSDCDVCVGAFRRNTAINSYPNRILYLVFIFFALYFFILSGVSSDVAFWPAKMQYIKYGFQVSLREDSLRCLCHAFLDSPPLNGGYNPEGWSAFGLSSDYVNRP